MWNPCAAGPGPLRLPVRMLALCALAAVLADPGRAAGITGICPDGSVYIVQSRAQIPCARSKEVEPHEVPPLRPEYLPSPYTWQVWNENQNPNNPYNLIDAARQVRGIEAPHAAPGATPPVSAGPPGTGAALPTVAAPQLPEGPLDLGLSDEELRNLFLIVELSQERVPAGLARETADGRERFQLAFAHSSAFEARLREAWASRGGLGRSRVLLFSAVSKDAEPFYANFTFVQDHLSYQPDAANPRQVGILQGRLGSLDSNEAVLGYIVLPETIDLAESLDLYWNDRHTAARFEG